MSYKIRLLKLVKLVIILLPIFDNEYESSEIMSLSPLFYFLTSFNSRTLPGIFEIYVIYHTGHFLSPNGILHLLGNECKILKFLLPFTSPHRYSVLVQFKRKA